MLYIELYSVYFNLLRVPIQATRRSLRWRSMKRGAKRVLQDLDQEQGTRRLLIGCDGITYCRDIMVLYRVIDTSLFCSPK